MAALPQHFAAANLGSAMAANIMLLLDDYFSSTSSGTFKEATRPRVNVLAFHH
jgi:hypothetical protein